MKTITSRSFREIITRLVLVLAFGVAVTACNTTSSATPTQAINPPVENPTSIPVTGLATPAIVATTPATASLPTDSPDGSTPAQPSALPAACASPSLTPALTEGPYFKPGSPERSSLLEAGTSGTKLVLSGYVLTQDCKPMAHALLDFWQADAQGQYDNSGYTLRGHQFTDATGRYQLETVIPGLYPGRTEHIHVKIQAPGGKVLTTQLFFPGVANNASDGIFDQNLVITMDESANPVKGSFNFIIQP